MAIERAHSDDISGASVAVTKLVAAVITGSAAMFSEAVHSVVDCGNEGLLLYGYHRAARRPDIVHPLGYGRELYFWSFIVALMLFALGAGVSLYQGVRHVLDPRPVEYVEISYAVLALSFFFEAASWIVAWICQDQGDARLLGCIQTKQGPTVVYGPV